MNNYSRQEGKVVKESSHVPVKWLWVLHKIDIVHSLTARKSYASSSGPPRSCILCILDHFVLRCNSIVGIWTSAVRAARPQESGNRFVSNRVQVGRSHNSLIPPLGLLVLVCYRIIFEFPTVVANAVRLSNRRPDATLRQGSILRESRKRNCIWI